MRLSYEEYCRFLESKTREAQSDREPSIEELYQRQNRIAQAAARYAKYRMEHERARHRYNSARNAIRDQRDDLLRQWSENLYDKAYSDEPFDLTTQSVPRVPKPFGPAMTYPEYLQSSGQPWPYDETWDDVPETNNARDESYQEEKIEKGGEGSGNFAHKGRPGQVGGSGPGGSALGAASQAVKSYFDLGQSAAKMGKHLGRAGLEVGKAGAYAPGVAVGFTRSFPKTAAGLGILASLYAAKLGLDFGTAYLKNRFWYSLMPEKGQMQESDVEEQLATLDREVQSELEAMGDDGDKVTDLMLALAEEASHGTLSSDTMPTLPEETLAEIGLTPEEADALTPLALKMATSMAIQIGKANEQDDEFEDLPIEKGGPGSGFYGHEGRPGEIGGSAPDDGGDSAPVLPPISDAAKDFTRLGAHIGGSALGLEAGSMLDRATKQAAGQALMKISPSTAGILRAAAAKIPIVSKFMRFIPGPWGIALSLIGGTVAQAGVGLLLDYLEDKGVSSAEDIENLSEEDLAEAPTPEDAAMASKPYGKFGKPLPDPEEEDIQQAVREHRIEAEKKLIIPPGSKFNIDDYMRLWEQDYRKHRAAGTLYKPIQKGSSRSGFWGHSGRKGRHGGSAYSLGKPPVPGIQLKQQKLTEGMNMHDDFPSYAEFRRRIMEGWSYDESTDEWYWEDEPVEEEPSYDYSMEEPVAEEPTTVPIDQFTDETQYAEAPTATDASRAGEQASWWDRFWGTRGVGETPEEIAMERAKRPPWTAAGVPGEDQPPLRAEVPKEPYKWEPEKPEFEGVTGFVAMKNNPNGTVTMTLRDGSEKTFKDVDQAMRWGAEWQDPEKAPKPVKPLGERLKQFGTKAAEQVYNTAEQLSRGELPEWLSGETPKARPYDPNTTPEPASMPAYNVYPDGRVAVYKDDGTTELFADRTSAFNKYAGKVGWGDTPPMILGVKTPPEDPRKKFPDMETRPPEQAGSTFRGPSAPSVPGETSTPGTTGTARGDKWAARMAALGKPPEEGDPYLAETPISMPVRGEGESLGDYEKRLDAMRRRAATTGQAIELPQLPKRSAAEGSASDAQALKNLDAALPENIRREERKRQQEERDVRGQEIAAQQREMDFNRKKAEYENWLKQQRRGGYVPPAGAEEPMSYAEYQQVQREPALRPQPAARPAIPVRPGSPGVQRQNFMAYAAKNGLKVQERNGKVYVAGPGGKQLSFDSYDKAMSYFQRGPKSEQYVQRVQKDAHSMTGMSMLDDECERIGAECMRGERSGRITIVIPGEFAKQFDSEEEALTWLSENSPNVGA